MDDKASLGADGAITITIAHIGPHQLGFTELCLPTAHAHVGALGVEFLTLFEEGLRFDNVRYQHRNLLDLHGNGHSEVLGGDVPPPFCTSPRDREDARRERRSHCWLRCRKRYTSNVEALDRPFKDHPAYRWAQGTQCAPCSQPRPNSREAKQVDPL